MPTQKRSLTICFQRGVYLASARMALGCARKLVRDGDFKGAEGPLRATVESLKTLEYYVYAYDKESLKTIRELPKVIVDAVAVLRSKKPDKAKKVKIIDMIDGPLETLHEKIQGSCKGKLPGYAAK